MLLHRHVWAQANGPIPEGKVIDHINGDRYDNRLENLRLVTQGQNLMNRPSSVGVVWSKQARKWQAQIKVGGRVKYLCRSDCYLDALSARRNAEKEHFGEHAPVRQAA